jgi:hypothetical protein
VKLPTPDCPWCARRTEDRGDHFACAYCAGIAPTMPPLLPEPVEWYMELAALYGRNALDSAGNPLIAGCRYPPDPRGAYREARWAARAAMRAVPELREWE